MADGYVKGKPDTSWWLQQIHAGRAYRKKYAKEEKWTTWRNYYRGNWTSGTLPKTIFFSMARRYIKEVTAAF